MAVDVTIQPIPSGYNITKINNNFLAIQTALEDAVSLSGNLPNSMGGDLDMNGNDLLNTNNLTTNTLYVGGTAFFPGNVSVQGDKGWSPVFGIVNDGSRRVFQLAGYVGGTGTTPTANIGQYVGVAGYTAVLANGIDIRGPTGAGTGDMLAANNLSEIASPSVARTNLGIGNINNTADSAKPVSTAQAAADLVAQTQETAYNPQVTSYTAVLADAGALVSISNASANTFTIPPNSSVAFPPKTKIDYGQYGVGQTTITAGAGVTIRSASAKIKTTGQYSGCSLIKIGTDEWWLFGDLA